MFAITKDQEGKELSRLELTTASQLPTNGFEKNEDGNFYKIMDDPRCITDILAKKLEEEVKKEEIARTETVSSIRPLLDSIKDLKPKYVSSMEVRGRQELTRFFESPVKFTSSWRLEMNLRASRKSWGGGMKEEEQIKMRDVRFENIDLGIKNIAKYIIPYVTIWPGKNKVEIFLESIPGINRPEICIEKVFDQDGSDDTSIYGLCD